MNLIIHVVGLEGCGHHGLEKVVTNLLKADARYVDKTVLNNIISQKCRNCDNHDLFENVVRSYLCDKNAIIYTDDSYPSGVSRTVATQKNILKLHDTLSRHGDVLFIHLKRNIFNTINSHPQHDGGILAHTRVLKDTNEHIVSQLEILKSRGANVIDLNYEDINKEKGQYIISKALNVDLELVQETVNDCFKMSNKNYRELLNKDTIDKITEIWD